LNNSGYWTGRVATGEVTPPIATVMFWTPALMFDGTVTLIW
jgi:hypothetical protein